METSEEKIARLEKQVSYLISAFDNLLLFTDPHPDDNQNDIYSTGYLLNKNGIDRAKKFVKDALALFF